MKGIIAAGSEIAAKAGAQILETGGNAVSAAIAACFATSASEPSLVSLAGGGVMIIYNKEKGIKECVNFFSNMPGLGLSEKDLKNRDFYPVKIDFSSASQYFKVGRAAAAPGGALLAFCQLAESLGNLPLSDLIQPSLPFLKKGVSLGEKQNYMREVLKPIYEVSQEAKKLLFPQGKKSFFKNEKTALFLESLASGNWREVYEEDFCKKILEEFGPRAGGLITEEDLKSFETLHTRPLEGSYKGTKILTASQPACGGEFILASLSLLEKNCSEEEVDLESLAYVFQSLSELKVLGGKDFLSEEKRDWLRESYEKSKGKPFSLGKKEPQERSSTTHISVIDQERTCVTVTFSHGEGCGHLVGNTGIMMNNFIGEDDVAPCGYERALAGERLSTMVAPSILETKEGDLHVLGSGGANRIRSSLVQVILHLLEGKKTPEEAVSAVRLHVESGEVSTEMSIKNKALARFLKLAEPLESNLFSQKDVYFGGVNLVSCLASGKIEGAGDPRRGGFCVKVE